MLPKLKSGFTLIELLIVVAIIAILAAIAVPNFLEAQVRAKVARAKNDLRTLATAIESYTVDNNRAPIDGSAPDDRQAYWYPPGGPTVAGGVGGLTSPVAYLSSVVLVDPFRTQAEAQSAYTADAPDSQYFTVNDYRRYRYANFRYTYIYGIATPNESAARSYEAVYGTYRLTSSGPDRTAGGSYTVTGTGGLSTITGAYVPYDPTNGTASAGDIIRSQKYTEQPYIDKI